MNKPEIAWTQPWFDRVPCPVCALRRTVRRWLVRVHLIPPHPPLNVVAHLVKKISEDAKAFERNLAVFESRGRQRRKAKRNAHR